MSTRKEIKRHRRQRKVGRFSGGQRDSGMNRVPYLLSKAVKLDPFFDKPEGSGPKRKKSSKIHRRNKHGRQHP